MAKKRKNLEIEDLEQKAKLEYLMKGKPDINDILIKLDDKIRTLIDEGYGIEGFECWIDHKEANITVFGIK